MRRIEVTATTMGQSNPATVSEGTGYYHFRGDKNWPADRSAYTKGDLPPGVVPAGMRGSTERKQQRLERFEAALAEAGYTPENAPAKAVREAGKKAGVGADTARCYRLELERRMPHDSEARDD